MIKHEIKDNNVEDLIVKLRMKSPYDPNIESLVKNFRDRVQKGYKKYGATTDQRKDLSIKDWILHLKEELMDSLVYCQAIKNSPDYLEGDTPSIKIHDTIEVLFQKLIEVHIFLLKDAE